MTAPREFHTATLLASGKVLIAGGSNGTAAQRSADLYDPLAGTFSATASMAAARQYFTATATSAGVLVAGGLNGSTRLQSAELYQGAVFVSAAT